MFAKTIDAALCDGCGKCVGICKGHEVLEPGEGGIPRYAHLERCMECGHCLSVCPKGAISFAQGKDDGGCLAGAIEDSGALDPVLALLFSIRSDRFYTEKPGEEDKGGRILEAMVRAPSAGNERNQCYYTLLGADKVAKLDARVVGYYRSLQAGLSTPFARKLAAAAYARRDFSKVFLRNRLVADLPRKERGEAFLGILNNLAKLIASEGYTIFHKAPAVILVTSRTDIGDMHKGFAKSDAEIAVTYGAVAAASMGLSTCRIGLAEIAFGRDTSLGRELGIPENERLDSGLVVGYGATEWKRIPPRGPVKVTAL